MNEMEIEKERIKHQLMGLNYCSNIDLFLSKKEMDKHFDSRVDSELYKDDIHIEIVRDKEKSKIFFPLLRELVDKLMAKEITFEEIEI